jgi:hypothetical protein
MGNCSLLTLIIPRRETANAYLFSMARMIWISSTGSVKAGIRPALILQNRNRADGHQRFLNPEKISTGKL